MTDPIADYLTRVRNAYLAKHKIVEIPASKMKMEITRILHEKGYILSYKLVEGTPYKSIIPLPSRRLSRRFREFRAPV